MTIDRLLPKFRRIKMILKVQSESKGAALNSTLKVEFNATYSDDDLKSQFFPYKTLMRVVVFTCCTQTCNFFKIKIDFVEEIGIFDKKWSKNRLRILSLGVFRAE